MEKMVDFLFDTSLKDNEMHKVIDETLNNIKGFKTLLENNKKDLVENIVWPTTETCSKKTKKEEELYKQVIKM